MILYFVIYVSSQMQGIHQDVLGQCGVLPHLWKPEPSDLELNRTWSKSISYIPWHICIFSYLPDAQKGTRVGVSLISPWLYPLKWCKKIFPLSLSFYLFWDKMFKTSICQLTWEQHDSFFSSRTWCAHLPPASCQFECNLSILKCNK